MGKPIRLRTRRRFLQDEEIVLEDATRIQMLRYQHYHHRTRDFTVWLYYRDSAEAFKNVRFSTPRDNFNLLTVLEREDVPLLTAEDEMRRWIGYNPLEVDEVFPITGLWAKLLTSNGVSADDWSLLMFSNGRKARIFKKIEDTRAAIDNEIEAYRAKMRPSHVGSSHSTRFQLG